MNQKTVLINGGSRGIGAAMVKLFAQSGYKVAFTYLHSEHEAKELAKEYGALAIVADSANEEDILRAVKEAEASLGAISVLINNAAISQIGLFTDLTPEEWERMRRINLEGPMYYTRLVLDEMIRRKEGRIIQVSSMWGQVGASCEVAYSTTKAALIGFTKALAKELGPSGITVNAIAPGLIATDMNASLDQNTLASLCEETPLCRMGTPDEVASVALFLASEGGSFITGQIISPNGGYVV